MTHPTMDCLLPKVAEAIRQEAGDLSLRLADLEVALAEIPTERRTDRFVRSVQSLDAMQQTLSDLSRFFGTLAGAAGRRRTCGAIQQSIDSVRQARLRRNLAAGGPTSPHDGEPADDWLF